MLCTTSRQTAAPSGRSSWFGELICTARNKRPSGVERRRRRDRSTSRLQVALPARCRNRAPPARPDPTAQPASGLGRRGCLAGSPPASGADIGACALSCGLHVVIVRAFHSTSRPDLCSWRRVCPTGLSAGALPVNAHRRKRLARHVAQAVA